MPFGLRNAAQTCQRFLDEFLQDFDLLFCYIDDILVASDNEEEHQQNLRMLFDRLKKYGILINSVKCIFGSNTVKFLGYEVSDQGIKPLPEKVDAILKFPQPLTAKGVRRFLGMLNSYRRFIPAAAGIQAQLNDLLRGNLRGKAPVEWNETALHSFEESKKALAQAALLAFPAPESLLAIFTDASNFALGAALHQRIDNHWQPLAFLSKKLNNAEKNNGAYDKELLAIYKSFDIWSKVEVLQCSQTTNLLHSIFSRRLISACLDNSGTWIL